MAPTPIEASYSEFIFGERPERLEIAIKAGFSRRKAGRHRLGKYRAMQAEVVAGWPRGALVAAWYPGCANRF